MAQTPAGISSFGAYLPRLRLQRKAIAAANAWFNPSVAALGKGVGTYGLGRGAKP